MTHPDPGALPSGDPDMLRQDPLTAETDDTGIQRMRRVLDDLTDADPLQRLRLLHELRDLVDAAIEVTVAEARAGRASWTSIGEAAGMSRQAAHERWRETTTPSPESGTGSSAEASATPTPESMKPVRARPTRGHRREEVTVRFGRIPVPLTFDVTRRAVSPIPRG